METDSIRSTFDQEGNMELLKGKQAADALTEKVCRQVEELKGKGILPTLAIVRAGENPSDLSYERGAEKRAEKTGITVKKYIYEETVSQEELLAGIETLNRDPSIHGVLIFRPLPKQIDDEAVRATLLPEKDIDGITEGSLSGIFTGAHRGFAPCTARACMEILNHYGIETEGKKAAVLGRSLVIGKPAAMLLMEQNATVTICHSRTGETNMKQICKDSDILIAAMGRAEMIDASYIKEGQIILDVGINVNEEGKLCGDVNSEKAGAAAYLTPVPGGVGAVTTAVLMTQVVEAAMKAAERQTQNV